MAENNNALVGKMPETPNSALKQLEHLIGKWKISRDNIDDEISFECMEGEFPLLQRFDLKQGGNNSKGIEYIGFDDTQTLRSRLMRTDGSGFTVLPILTKSKAVIFSIGWAIKARIITVLRNSARMAILAWGAGDGLKPPVKITATKYAATHV